VDEDNGVLQLQHAFCLGVSTSEYLGRPIWPLLYASFQLLYSFIGCLCVAIFNTEHNFTELALPDPKIGVEGWREACEDSKTISQSNDRFGLSWMRFVASPRLE
jgi:hypothetical protein